MKFYAIIEMDVIDGRMDTDEVCTPTSTLIHNELDNILLSHQNVDIGENVMIVHPIVSNVIEYDPLEKRKGDWVFISQFDSTANLFKIKKVQIINILKEEHDKYIVTDCSHPLRNCDLMTEEEATIHVIRLNKILNHEV